MKPILVYASNKQEHSYRNIIESLANKYNLTEDERKEYLPSGVMRIFDNRVYGRLFLEALPSLHQILRKHWKNH